MDFIAPTTGRRLAPNHRAAQGRWRAGRRPGGPSGRRLQDGSGCVAGRQDLPHGNAHPALFSARAQSGRF